MSRRAPAAAIGAVKVYRRRRRRPAKRIPSTSPSSIVKLTFLRAQIPRSADYATPVVGARMRTPCAQNYEAPRRSHRATPCSAYDPWRLGRMFDLDQVSKTFFHTAKFLDTKPQEKPADENARC